MALILVALPLRFAGQAAPALAALQRQPAGFEADFSLANTRLQPQSTTRSHFRLVQTGVLGPYRQLVFAIDVSESMAGEPLVALRRAVLAAVANLDRQSAALLEVGVVQFAGVATVRCQPSADRRLLASCLGGLTIGRGSDLEAGLSSASDLLSHASADPPLDGGAVILVADGPDAAGCAAVLGAARRARQLGALVATVALGDAADAACLAQAASAETAARALQPAALEGALGSLVPHLAAPKVGRTKLTLVLPPHLRFVADSADLVPWLVADSEVTWMLATLPPGGLELGFALSALGTGRGVPVMSAEVELAGIGRRTLSAVGPVVSVGAPPACQCPDAMARLDGGTRALIPYPLVIKGSSGCELGGDPEPAAWWSFELCGPSPSVATMTVTAPAGSRIAVYQPGVTPGAACRSALASGPAEAPLGTVLKPGPFAIALFGPATAADAEPAELTLHLGCTAPHPVGNVRPAEVWVQVFGADVYGSLPFSEPVAGVLKDAAGKVKAQSEEVYLDDDGAFRLSFAGRGLAKAPVVILPGDRVFLTPTGGRPFEVVVPVVSATTDTASDQVTGVAPPASELEVSILHSWAAGGEPAVPLTLSTTAAADGRFAASFAGHHDLVAGSYGKLWLKGADGRHFVWEWAAPRLTFRVDAPGRLQLSGTGPYLRSVRAALIAPGGRWLAQGAGRIDAPGSPSEWRVSLVDRTGSAVEARAGDRLQAWVGDDVVTATIPTLSAQVDLVTDRLEASAPPGARLTVRGPGFSAPASSDAAGRVVVDLSPWHRYRLNDPLSLELTQAGHIFSAGFVPGLRLAAGSGCLAGRVKPLSAVQLAVGGPPNAPGGPTRPLGTTSAGDGSFQICPLDVATRPRPGETLTITVAGAALNPRLGLIVPALGTAIEPAAGSISGQASEAGELTFDLLSPRGFDRQLVAARSLTLAAGGLFNLALGQAPYAAGTVLAARYRPESGHEVTMTTATPSMRVEHGGSLVCGTGRPGEVVTVTVEDEHGATQSQASGRVDEAGQFSLVPRRPNGEAEMLDDGEAVRLQIGPDSFFAPLSAMRLDLDFTSGLLSGQLPPRAPYEVALGAAGCLGLDRFAGGDLDDRPGPRMAIADLADADGRFGQQFEDALAPGEALIVHVPLATGGLVFRRAVRPLVIATRGSADVSGVASPGTPIAAQLMDGAGNAVAGGEAEADTAGDFRLTLVDTDGRKVPVGAFGRTLAVTAAGEAFAVPLEPLTATFSRDTGVGATAPPGRTLRLRLTLRTPGRLDYGGQPIPDPALVSIKTDEHGRAAFGLDDVPPRGGWTLADVAAAEVALVTARGDEVRLPLDVPRVGAEEVYLPWLGGR